MGLLSRRIVGFVALTGLFLVSGIRAADTPPGVLPSDEKGRPLNLDFEAGTLDDWTADGPAFEGQPVEGDTIHARRKDMESKHQGKFWAGSFEGKGDASRGTLTSAPFTVSKPWATFLVAGGSRPTTRVEIVDRSSKKVVYQTTGDDTEELKPVAVDLSAHRGRQVFVRLVDDDSGPWGHINFDNFRLHDARPDVPPRPNVAAPDVFAHEGLSPEDAAKAMTVPDGFKVTLFAGEPDVVQPIAQAIDDRGRLWVAEAYSYPVRVPEAKARDRILIFEDVDGDGHFDKRTVFADKLNLVSGLEVGFGGVWVGSAPNFLFIPDKDGDDRPDGPPQVLLDGWGYHDTHETLNSFTWGPDGWLYGCHGVFTHSRVGKPGTPDKDRVPINAGIWRYHPTRHTFEVFAHGTSNPWGVDFDRDGRAFLTSCVIPHLYQINQGGRYERQAGAHFNPYTFDDIKTIADHRHWVGATPHSGNGRSDNAGGGHAHAGALIYQGDSWPLEYRGSIFMNNIHGARLNRDTLETIGSGFVGRHAPDFLMANDRWSQIINIQSGPDGNVYMIDWYDKNQCHHNDINNHDRTNGRVFKVSYGNAKVEPVDLKLLRDDELVRLTLHPNEWYVRHARRILQERGPNHAVHAPLLKILKDASLPEPQRLRALWVLHVTGGLSPSRLEVALNGPPSLRAWGVQLACEEGAPAPEIMGRMAMLAREDRSPVVRLYVASALQRLPVSVSGDMLAGLIRHPEDAADVNLPLMYWYAAERVAADNPERALRITEASAVPLVFENTVRRVAAEGTPDAIGTLVVMLGRHGAPRIVLPLLRGLNEALKGRRSVAAPEEWAEVGPKLAQNPDPEVRAQAIALSVTFGDPKAFESLKQTAADTKADPDARRFAVEALLRARPKGLAPALQDLVADPTLRALALRGLAAYDDPKTPEVLIEAYPKFSPAEKRDAMNTLSSRADFADAMLAAVEAKRVPAADLSADLIRQLRNLKSAGVNERIGRVWGVARETAEDKVKLIARYKAMLTSKPAKEPDVMLGRAVFARTCQQCHTLFGVGGKVGPELTGSNRRDLDYVLSNVLDPSAQIGKDYLAHVVATTDGRVLTGIVRAEDKDAVTLVTANETVILPKDEIDQRRPSDRSMMPDDLWSPLSEHEVRSLVAYLAAPAQVPMLATPENVSSFFNGRDLTGWQSKPGGAWTVREGGEIDGVWTGGAGEAFLTSDMALDTFRLTMKVKLDGPGTAWVLFRGDPTPDGSMRECHAVGLGPGAWGRLFFEKGTRATPPTQAAPPGLHENDWNTVQIVAAGEHLRVLVNGQRTASRDSVVGPDRGTFAFRLGGREPVAVRIKDLRLGWDPDPQDD